ncbi:spermidine synthase [Parvibaculum lavamentivorans DS-1]|uniref:Polyamine aminopropyltransferase n=1 Tax=Parvibaculum lavamentivorans (strain DS-1 / DSM 13023 / NCIMB 13966) TaxID=402881 RepID=A7HQM3_PARL1|nr:polyamine aminopropyltransferase [Parvibaculum lavamentivorans]ABS62206.1 spermidine synthase [Parvibaculum lavamentivorans DS-1]
MTEAPKGRWIVETLYEKEGFTCAFRADKVFHEENTAEQNLVIFENALFGRMMALDGITQVTERDEFIYHEMMTHVPILAHGRVRRVLIIGGGDGGILREVLRHKKVDKVTMVEIDPAVTDFCKKQLPKISDGAFDDPRLDLVFADGAKFVEETTEKYDVIIVDSTDPIGPGEVLFRESFYRAASGVLTPGGVIVTQNGVPFMQGSELKATMEKFRRLFKEATCYLATIPTYVGGPMAMGWGTDDATLTSLPLEEIERRFAEEGFATRYYTPEVHKAAFALPRYVLDCVAP